MKVVDIHHAGTAAISYRFFAVEGREVVLTGSQRMTERPIKFRSTRTIETIIS
jgi:3-phosphoshikimate 1-carboxyvinyltransferase